MNRRIASKLRLEALLTIFTLALVGCASTPLPQQYVGTTSVVVSPAVNTQATAELGQTIISKSNLTVIPAIRLEKDASEVVNSPGRTTIRAGVISLFATNESGRFFRDYRATYTALGTTVANDTAGIFIPHDKSNPPVVYHYAMGYKFGGEPVAGITETTTNKWSKDSFKRELIYSGVSQNTISISYREFVDDIARPAFSQELKYDLSQGTTIGYKGARFEVIKANNTELVYRVVKPLD
jgi:hypothetical protein